MAKDEKEIDYGVERTVIVKFSEADYQRLMAITERENIKPAIYVEDATLIRINNNTTTEGKGNGTL